MKLGPDGFTKIAILGTAPSSMGLAPFKDQSWSIWACSPGAYPLCAQNRSDVFFELHRWLPSQPGRSGAAGTRPWFSPEFHMFLQNHAGPVYMTEAQGDIKNSIRYPYEEMLAKHGPYFFSSTVAWMLAWAIEQNPKVIGLYGVDMAADSEYAYQRPACQHFIGLALALGIEVILPPESDLMRPTTLYGIGEINPRHVKLRERLMEFEAQKNVANQQMQQAQTAILQLQGAIDATKYMLTSWCDDIVAEPTKAYSFAGQPVGVTFVEQVAAGAEAVGKLSKKKGNGLDHAASP